MGIEYLSDVWVKQLTDAFNSDEAATKTISDEAALIQMNVTGAPTGDVTYHFRIADGRLLVALGPPADPPLAQATLGYDTAVSLSKGDVNGANAMMSGKMTIVGDITMVLRVAAALDLIPEVSKKFEIDY